MFYEDIYEALYQCHAIGTTVSDPELQSHLTQV